MTVRQWTVLVEITRPDGTSEQHAVGSIRRDMASLGLDDLGLHAAEAEALLRQVQQRLVQDRDAGQSSHPDAGLVGQNRREHGDPCLALPDSVDAGERRDARQRGGKRRALCRSGRDGGSEGETGHGRVGRRRPRSGK